ncbi:MAG: type 4a pilus biogenesis protein PilO [Candidatus Omnitrophica bacterium]|nr:type 4a pilus biogenesis protein PilO [Candidatus Omnitrophota bacterium]
MTPPLLRALKKVQGMAGPLLEAVRKKPKWLGPLAALGLIVILWSLYAVPLGRIRKLQAGLLPLKEQVARAQEVIQRARQVNLAALPAADALPQVLEELNALARQHEVQLVKTAPQPTRPAESRGLVILPLELQVEAEYRNLGEFLGALRRAPGLGVPLTRRIALGREERLLPRLTATLTIDLILSEAPGGS